MKVEQAKAVEVPEELVCASGGAKVGDTIIFSPHHPKNAHLVNGEHYIKCNIPYVVIEIDPKGPWNDRGSHAVWVYKDEYGQANRSSYNGGHYDVIIRAPRPEP